MVVLVLYDCHSSSPDLRFTICINTLYSLTPISDGKSSSNTTLDLQIAVCQLAVEVFLKLPRGIQRKQAAKATKLSQLAQSKLACSGEEAREGLREVIEGLAEVNL